MAKHIKNSKAKTNDQMAEYIRNHKAENDRQA